MVDSVSFEKAQQSTLPHDYQKFSPQYSQLKIEDSYFLAFRTAAELLEKERLDKSRVLDFGCGAGRSTRFLKSLGFETTGIDISRDMLAQARQQDQGDYHWLNSKVLPFSPQSFDIIFQSFVLLEYSSTAQITETFTEFNRVLDDNGTVIVVTGSEEYYCHDWLSFKIGNGDKIGVEQENSLTSGSQVKVAIRGTNIVLLDYFWTDADYRKAFQAAGFDVIKMVQPLAQGDEPFDWVNECQFPCWTIYVLKKR